MVTGDNILTALSVAKKCKIIDVKEKTIMVVLKDQSFSQENNEKNEFDCIKRPNIIWCHLTNFNHEDTNHNGSKFSEIELTNNIIIDEECKNNYHFCISGNNWTKIRKYYPEIIPQLVLKGSIFARFAPEQKQQLVEELQNIDYYVGMCGDGANDCGALKTAHTGISLSEAEASVASPFTSKRPDVSCVIDLIKEGRCALVTSFGIFQYMMGYSLTQFLFTCLIYWKFGWIFSDFQFLYQDLIMLTSLCITACFAKAYPVLSVKKPLISLVALSPIFSLILIICLNLAAMIYGYFDTQKQPWFDELKINGGYYLPSVVYLYGLSHFVTMAIVFCRGFPFRRNILRNYPLTINILILTIFNILIIMYPAEWWNNLLSLRMPPSYEYRGKIVGVSILHFFVCYFYERVINERLLENIIQPFLSKLFLNKKTKHEILELDNNIWSSLTKISIKDYMKLESH